MFNIALISLALNFITVECTIKQNIIIWDNDGTIMGSKDPNDSSSKSRVILPNVQKVMQKSHTINVVCSGCKTPESELQNFDPERIIIQLKKLMTDLPIDIATFSPAIGGTECWVIIKKGVNDFEIRKAHEDDRYKHLIGQFKKPGIGMLVVIKDLLGELLIISDETNTVFIGDAWQDQKAANDFGIPFIEAKSIHTMQDEHYLDFKK